MIFCEQLLLLYNKYMIHEYISQAIYLYIYEKAKS